MRWPLTANSIRLRRIIPIAYQVSMSTDKPYKRIWLFDISNILHLYIKKTFNYVSLSFQIQQRRLKTRLDMLEWSIMFYPPRRRTGQEELDCRCPLDPIQDRFLLALLLDHPHPQRVRSHLLLLHLQTSKQQHKTIRHHHLRQTNTTA